jgi:hypothetical protein
MVRSSVAMLNLIVDVRREATNVTGVIVSFVPKRGHGASKSSRKRVVVCYIRRNLQLDDSAAERNGHRAGAIGCVQLFQDVLHMNLYGLFR